MQTHIIMSTDTPLKGMSLGVLGRRIPTTGYVKKILRQRPKLLRIPTSSTETCCELLRRGTKFIVISLELLLRRITIASPQSYQVQGHLELLMLLIQQCHNRLR